MHELLHIIGLCPDALSHPSVMDIAVASWQNIPYVNFKNIKLYVTKCIRSRKSTTN